ncbi:hypothetical protein QWZ08_13180 [Ferruginibacter paludis]|nr:hypothetical protein [Ferruginibacter paludis]MDN3656592.1 hypothetical protein [Ferruginibacter paludis]
MQRSWQLKMGNNADAEIQLAVDFVEAATLEQVNDLTKYVYSESET